MSGTIEQAFVKQFEAEVAEAYPRQGSKLRPTIRSKTNVKGSSTLFPRVGKGTAAAKARNGVVPVMNLTYSNAECFLQDYYAGEWIDRLDEIKTNIDEVKGIPRVATSLPGKYPGKVVRLATGANPVGQKIDGARVAREVEEVAS